MAARAGRADAWFRVSVSWVWIGTERFFAPVVKTEKSACGALEESSHA